ncbi:MAG: HlyD family efflux transporter periplasmic adaptor subunit, partial [Verrucomicrobiota bacterium]
GLQGAWKRFWGGASQVKKTVFVAAPILFAGVMLLPLPYRIAADCRLQPKQSRQIAAPFDGILEESFVKPGMRVGEGDLLAVLDGKEIHWRLANAKARREAAMKERDQALPKGDVGAMQLAQLEADGLALEVELLEYKKENLEIRAPIEGTVLSGNLERSKGVPVSTGQKLFDLAPIDTFEVEIHVPDSEVNSVEVGQKVQFRLESQARFRFESTLSEVYPISEVHDDRNVFVCLSTIDGKGEVLRPGMRGKARIVTPARPLGWIIFHRLWDSIRLRFW